MNQKLPVFVAGLALLVVVGIWWNMRGGPERELGDEVRHVSESADRPAPTPEQRQRNANRGDLRARREAWMAARERGMRDDLSGGTARSGGAMANSQRNAAPSESANAADTDADKPALAQKLAGGKAIATTENEIEELKHAALSDPDPDERINALWSLSISDEAQALPVLTSALRDEDREVRLAAVQELGGLEDERGVVDSLSFALNDADTEVRQEAVRLIGETDDPRAAEIAGRLLNDPDPEVREEAQSVVESAEE